MSLSFKDIMELSSSVTTFGGKVGCRKIEILARGLQYRKKTTIRKRKEKIDTDEEVEKLALKYNLRSIPTITDLKFMDGLQLSIRDHHKRKRYKEFFDMDKE